MRHRDRLGAIAIVLILGQSVRTTDARVWHVDPSGAGDAPTIQAAVDSAAAGDEVRLAPGTYTWTSQGSVEPAMIRLKRGLLLRSEDGAAATVLDAEHFETASVIWCHDVGGDTRIEGLTITGARSLSDGAGVSISGDSRPTIVQCIFRGNGGIGAARGGAVGGINATVVLENCQFIDNRAGGFGGAVACAQATITNCQFIGNRTSVDGSAAGGAVAVNTLVIRDCLFEENYAEGVVSAEGGAMAANSLDAERCVFRRNQIDGGSCNGGAVASSVDGRLVDCSFFDNAARGESYAHGGAVAMESANTIVGCIFLRNEARLSNGPGLGGAVFAEAGGSITSSTFVGNRGGTAAGVGGIYMDGGGTIHRSIVAFTAGQVCAGTPGPTWTCTNLFGNISNSICGNDGIGNFSVDPEFCAADPVNSENLGLQADSPCVPGNHPDGASCGLIGARAIECAGVEVTSTTWTSMKSIYRLLGRANRAK